MMRLKTCGEASTHILNVLLGKGREWGRKSRLELKCLLIELIDALKNETVVEDAARDDGGGGFCGHGC